LAVYLLCLSSCHTYERVTPHARQVMFHEACQSEVSSSAARKTAMHHNVPHCNSLQHTATHCNTLQHACQSRVSASAARKTAMHPQCTTRQLTATLCNTQQHTATRVSIKSQRKCSTQAFQSTRQQPFSVMPTRPIAIPPPSLLTRHMRQARGSRHLLAVFSQFSLPNEVSCVCVTWLILMCHTTRLYG